ncbi:hypothetical protein M409DRAFT_22993 [Zasmidium cellare ATCC 36951]|uniref:Amino acid transporter transmembrane domain-containing protein n=1 Tax=Zasmidium cellare ATCC 36951 TaxID=1080233 RepID=A0A6A6CI98_ZASCE|nr:uncharacterized protein M409DRAFT_22993 [Zasmidium cellare ATCC 36951]KAF2166944.1 hypothetical protein M409DRAFT_22993 [Zasmidium cellare ATCC 36951]
MAAPRFPDSAYITEKDLEQGNSNGDEQALPVPPSRSNSSKSVPSTLGTNPVSARMPSLPSSKASTTSTSRRGLVHGGEEEKKMNWWQAATVMLAETVSLGILSLPSAVKSVGILPGSILILGCGFITTYTGHEVYRFKMRFPQIRSFAEAGQLIGGSVGRWIVEVMQMAMLVFMMAGHIIIFRSMAFKLSEGSGDHICGVWWTVLALVINITCTLPRALKTNSWFSIFSCISIIAATFTAMASVIQASHDHPVKYDTVVQLGTEGYTFAAACAAVSNILVSFSGHIAYFNIISEMRQPSDFPKALLTTNFFTIALYALAGIIIYKFVGPTVASPALDSATPTAAKIAYGLAVPTIIVAGVIAALVAAKRAYDITWQHRPEVKDENTARAWTSWIAIVVTLWTVAWVVGNVIPWFNSLLAVIGAAVGTWICLGFPAIFWLFGSWREKDGWRGWRRNVLVWVNVTLFLLCLVASGLGLYGSVGEISSQSGSTRPFPCRGVD